MVTIASNSKAMKVKMKMINLTQPVPEPGNKRGFEVPRSGADSIERLTSKERLTNLVADAR